MKTKIKDLEIVQFEEDEYGGLLVLQTRSDDRCTLITIESDDPKVLRLAKEFPAPEGVRVVLKPEDLV